MIKIQPLIDTDWYKQEIKKLFFHARTKEKTIIKKFPQRIAPINNELKRMGLDINFEELIVLDFSEIKKLSQKRINYSLYPKISSLPKLYKKFSNKNLNNLIVNKFGIKVCPYCNRDFINNRSDSKTQAQLDHFYHKSKYRILSLCLYNLVPSCYGCNHTKLDESIGVSPHDTSYDFNSNLKISYIPLSTNYQHDSSKIKIKFRYFDGLIKKNIKQLHIDDVYMVHNDIVLETIKRKKIYNDTYVTELFQRHQDLFSSREELLQTIFCNYLKEKDFSKRPLSKMTADLIEELNTQHIKNI